MNMGNLASQASAHMGNLANQASSPSMAQNPVAAISNRQKQLQEQQRELERRQKELEVQRQQLVAAMEERRRVMQQMQQKMQGPQGAGGQGQLQRSSLSHLGGNPGLLMGLQNSGLGNTGILNSALASQPHSGLASQQHSGLASQPHSGLASQQPLPLPQSKPQPQPGDSGQQWWVCKICNSKAFANREEAAQHESICIHGPGGDKGRRNSVGNNRRSSLDLLVGTLDRDLARQSQAMQQSAASGIHQTKQEDSDLGLDRRFSLSAENAGNTVEHPTPMSNGPFALMEHPLPLAMNPDKDWLTPLHCFVRRHCVQVFTATQKDVATPSKGKRKPIQVGQVGIRCPHCHHDETSKARERGSVYYPTTIASIYNATMNLLQRHLHNCSSVPTDIMRRYETLKADDARSGTSKKYWVESALSLGLVDTPNGIRFSALTPPPLPSLSRQQDATGNFSVARRNSNDFFSTNSNAISDLSQRSGGAVKASGENMDGSMGGKVDYNSRLSSGEMAGQANPTMDQQKTNIPETEQRLAQSAPLVTPDDEPYATSFSYHLLGQMQPCVFTEADRLGKRKGLPPGFPGLACRHCFGGYGSGRFFPSSIKTLSDTSKTLNVLHNHMMRCRKCPPEVRDTLDKLRKQHDEQRAKMKFGSQKAFFARIWDRLHFKDVTVNSKRKFQPQTTQAQNNAAMGTAPSFHQGGVMESAFHQGGVMDSSFAQYGDMMESKRRKMS
jgi:hypothetical protein